MNPINTKSTIYQPLLLALLLMFCGLQVAHAATLRVGAGLDPSVAGSYNTVIPALAVAVAGDVVDVGAGTYGESVTVPVSVTLKGAGINLTKIVGNIALGANSTIHGMEIIGNINSGTDSLVRNVSIVGELYTAPRASILDSTLTGYIRSTANSASDVRVINVTAAGVSQAVVAGHTNTGAVAPNASYFLNNLYVNKSSFSAQVGVPDSANVVVINNAIQGLFRVGKGAVVTGNIFFNFSGAPSGIEYTSYYNSYGYRRNRGGRYYNNYINMDSSTSCVFENNIIDRSANITTAEISFAVGCKVENNTFTARTDNVQAQAIGNLWKNNIIVSSLVAPATVDANGNMVGAPQFVNAATGDYHLAVGSAALNAGVGLNANGSVADIGAYGGVGSQVWVHNIGTASQPEVNHVLVQPTPVSPGEPLRLRFSAQTH